MTSKSFKSVQKALAYGYRSGLERKVGEQLENEHVVYDYEPKDGKLAYIQPESEHKYTPDFVFDNSPIIIETKGRFMASDRKKHILLRDQYPKLDFRFVFTNPNARINKGSPTTYAMWCKKQGFKYAKGLIPIEWLEEIKEWRHDNKRVK
jgi:hypothetical protein